ncbi:MAG: DNA photolyase family protein [Bacteroidia bacterium]|nr:DNA photolyase family protein [Bacteroidia bacterium]
MNQEYTAFWFRRDLRLDDNAGLFHALTAGKPVIPVFIFDQHILDDLPSRDARVEFIRHALEELQAQLTKIGSTLVVKYGKPENIWAELVGQYSIQGVYTNHDYEPYARERDEHLAEMLREKGVAFHTFQDQVIFEKDSILTQQGKPYTVFTPFSRTWKSTLTPEMLAPFETEKHFSEFWKSEAQQIPSLASMGFSVSGLSFPPRIPDKEIIKVYDEQRNFPAVEGTTRTGIHLRFGTLSIRKLVRVAKALNETYLNELIWREFYMQILWNFPHVVNNAFRPEYDAIEWRESEEDFRAWCEGRTGYPLVDAGMRQLNETGFMHNRVRMVTASFLTKHLLIDWRKGEAYFAQKLLDFELASNNGGWQWAAGSGTDAAPYFRIFNPESQLKKFDAQGKYVRRWVPEFGTPAYAREIVEHKFARDRCLEVYKAGLAGAKV